MIYKWYRRISKVLEHCYYVITTRELSPSEEEILTELISETWEPEKTMRCSFWGASLFRSGVVEIGPRVSIETPFSSNAVSICQAMGFDCISRIEVSRAYQTDDQLTLDYLIQNEMDQMTEERYSGNTSIFNRRVKPEEVRFIDLIGEDMPSLSRTNKEMGLGMDQNDLVYVYNLYANVLKRNPTNVELLQIGNGNSEHSRHWFFKGKQIIDGVEMNQTLLEIVQDPLKALPKENRSLLAFNDNSGAIRGFPTLVLIPKEPGQPSAMILREQVMHITCTAETHNHPTFVAPFPGAETGAGGRIRDNVAVGRGAIGGIGLAGYFVGNLNLDGYEIPGEHVGKDKPSKYASPSKILIDGSDGVSSYGNKIGEPLIGGFTRAFGQIIANEWIEARKPVLYSAGVGDLSNVNLYKEKPEPGMFIVRIGGPAYPIGIGGGSASSMMQGENAEELDLSSVQRGNPEMENRVNRVIRTCAELEKLNPIALVHDQGAGGPSNVLTESMEPLGGKIDIRKIVLGDQTMSVKEIWVAEFQEGYGLLIRPQNLDLFRSICERERVNCEVLGEITGDGKIVVIDSLTGETPVNLSHEDILGNVPQKTFRSDRRKRILPALDLPPARIADDIERVFKQLSVGSKGFLVHKVDRAVTGLVAQQQCCGLAGIPIADFALKAQSHFGLTGAVASLGEQPLKMLIDPKAGARMSVGEMLTNMAGVRITNIKDIRIRANWMWPAKLPHEGASLYDAATAMAEMVTKVGMAIDGGKDSLSMAAEILGELVKTPGELVMLGYAPVADITKKVTPDIKRPGRSVLARIELGGYQNRLGGSALGQSYGQLGNDCPDVESVAYLVRALEAIHALIGHGLVLSVHDRSDGGLITAVSEMCMASYCGFSIKTGKRSAKKEVFTEELGLFLEIGREDVWVAQSVCKTYGVSLHVFGQTTNGLCEIRDYEGNWIFSEDISTLRGWWESTSYQIERLQMDRACAEEEYADQCRKDNKPREEAIYHLTFQPTSDAPYIEVNYRPPVAILREEGTNSEREMQAVCTAAGLETFDINMDDLLKGKVTLGRFKGLIFPGGFSYMDVFGSAKGWAASILFNPRLREMFDRFYERRNTFSFGPCNGCQLMALLGWVPFRGIATENQPRFIENRSGRFESRWVSVKILPSPAIMLKGMQGSRLGVWSDHGEGRLFYPDQTIAEEIKKRNLSPIVYIDPTGERTERYPYNPNGSVDAIAGLCSPDGRHLAMMPHPERCFRLRQCQYVPKAWQELPASPWLRMFQNARDWCFENPNS